MRRLSAALAALGVPAPALAHAGEVHTLGWTFSPEIVVPLIVVLALYLAGTLRLGARSREQRLRARSWQFLVGWAILAGALVSPLHEAGEVSFTMHMIEHELIMLPAAFLLVTARPGPVLLWGLPQRVRTALGPAIRLPLWQALGGPVLATALQSAALIVWHMPALFDRALASDGWHIAQHASFLATALLFWWAMLKGRDRQSKLVAAVCLFVTSVVGGGLGALMALGSSPWYAGYSAMGLTPFGLSPVEDQQLAGLIMWIPGGVFHLGAALLILAQALRSAPERLDHRIGGGHRAA